MVTSAPARRVLPESPVASAFLMLVLTAMLYMIEAVDTVAGGALDHEGGILSRDPDGLDGIVFAPLLHGGWPHLIANTLPFLVFGYLAMAGGFRQFILVTAVIWVGSGVGVWVTGPGAPYVTIGASGVIFGWLVFLLVRGFVARSGRQIVLAVVLFFMWGGVLWGVLPTGTDASWQAHLFGALSGLLAAWLFARPAAARRPRSALS